MSRYLVFGGGGGGDSERSAFIAFISTDFQETVREIALAPLIKVQGKYALL